ASGHFNGRLLGIDPHRLKSYTKRQMRRHKSNGQARPSKKSQTFFCLDVETSQPIVFTGASAARTVAQATPELLELAREVLALDPGGNQRPLVLADEEHYTGEIFDQLRQQPFDLLVHMKSNRHQLARWRT